MAGETEYFTVVRNIFGPSVCKLLYDAILASRFSMELLDFLGGGGEICAPLGVFDSRVPRKIFGSKSDEVTTDWRRLHNEELHDLYSSTHYSGDQIKKNGMDRACSMHGKEQRRIPGLGGETWGKETA